VETSNFAHTQKKEDVPKRRAKGLHAGIERERDRDVKAADVIPQLQI
jgi:hypothetical protein